jgi:hypothetical protein
MLLMGVVPTPVDYHKVRSWYGIPEPLSLAKFHHTVMPPPDQEERLVEPGIFGAEILPMIRNNLPDRPYQGIDGPRSPETVGIAFNMTVIDQLSIVVDRFQRPFDDKTVGKKVQDDASEEGSLEVPEEPGQPLGPGWGADEDDAINEVLPR